MTWCGEHVSSTAETIASSMMFFASAIAQTKNIIFAFGVINLSQQNPGHVAARVANAIICAGAETSRESGPVA